MNRKQRRANSGSAGLPTSVRPSQAPQQMFAEAFQLQQAGRLGAAETLYRKVLAIAPDNADVLCNFGTVLALQGKMEQAAAAWRQAIAVKPGMAAAYSNLGVALRHLGRSEEAARVARQAAALSPGDADVFNTLGLVELDLGREMEALAAWRSAIAIRPDHAVAHSNLGAALLRQDRLDDAVSSLSRAIALQPDLADAHSNLGAALKGLGRLDEAVAACRRAIAINPGHADAHSNLGAALTDQCRLDEAETACRKAVALDPANIQAHKNLGAALAHLGQPADSMHCLETAIRLRPADIEVRRNLLSVAIYRDDLDNSDLRAVHQQFGRLCARAHAPLPAGNRGPERCLRVGYLSSDLRQHPVADSLMPLIRHHDRNGFEPVFYANVAQPDAVTARFREMAADWRDIGSLGDAEVATLIRDDRIDILVSVAGRLDANRPQVCAWRAAPVQVSLYDTATSGMPEMDYLVADRWMAPRSTGEWYAERVLRLPSSLIVYDFPAALPEVPTIRRPGPPVLACFNSPTKISTTALDLWGRILACAPDATLLLKYSGNYKCEALRANFQRRLEAAGARPNQIRFLADAMSRAEFLELYNSVDVALDTMPFSGWTASFQALSMGVPVVTWPWDRMASRFTASLLRGAGLDELVAASGDSYVRLAAAIAGDAASWHARRSELRHRIRDRVCAADRWTRNVERLYRSIWRRYCRSQTGI
jgi:predicted O-linked N-acetylglucosamine transferase (SPINDLY family)